MKQFIFIVHPLTDQQRKAMALRCQRWSALTSGDYDYSDVGILCRFRLGRDIEGTVVSVPLLPEELLADQQRSLGLIQHAICVANASGQSIDVVGLGSLCSIIGGRGSALQSRLSIPVTTGNAATAWCMYKHTVDLYREGTVAILGSGSPVGRILTGMLHQKGIPIQVDTKRAAKKRNIPYDDISQIAPNASLILGCGPTGPVLDPSILKPNTVIVDVALPQTLTTKSSHTVYMGEAMSMPRQWKRGFWGPLYHMVSGYGWNTVLACLVEPLALVASGRKIPYAQGATLREEDVLAFGDMAEQLGFHPKRILHSQWIR
ncbi:MAG: hypothetical protein VX278_14400 [Myxococcota bacterium]|nr:hypothetical protein [Myxococcota bacterium]